MQRSAEPRDAGRPVAAAIGIDVGGGAVKAGAVLLDPSGCVRPAAEDLRVAHHLGADGADLAALCARTARTLHAGLAAAHPGIPVVWGVSAAAWIDPHTGRSVFSPHLPGWRDRPLPADLAAALSSLTGRPVASDDAEDAVGPGSVPRPPVLNDADAAAWAEARMVPAPEARLSPAPDARPGHGRMVLVAIGTGIGGALVREGVVDTGAHGMAGEYGHMTVDPGGPPCPCGNTGCWELLVSAGALAARAGHPTARTALDAALAGEPRGLQAVTQTGRWLGRGLATLAAVLDPDRFVIGGGVAAAGELLLRPAREELAAHLPGRRHRPVPDVVVARLGNRAGWLGAAGTALERGGWTVTDLRPDAPGDGR